MPEENEPNFYARVEDDGSGNPNPFKFHILKIDTFGSPHETGKYVSTMRALRTPIAEATLWIEEEDEDTHYTVMNNDGTRDDDEEPEPKIYIAGPPSHAFPINEGWTPADPQPDPKFDKTDPPHHQTPHQTLHAPRSRDEAPQL